MRRRSSPVPAAGVARPAAGGSPTAGLPAWLSLQLTQLVDMAPDGDQWLHEIKYDGYRMHARLDRGVNLWPTVRESEERLSRQGYLAMSRTMCRLLKTCHSREFTTISNMTRRGW
jgi:hypothetical protein